MAVAFVQSISFLTSTSATPHVQTFASSVTAGNCIVVCTATRNFGLVSSVTDSLGNSYSKATSISINSNETSIWYATNIVGGACTVTVNYAAATTGRIFIREYSGVAKNLLNDVSLSSAQAATLNYSIGPTASTTLANELVVAVFASGSSSTTAPTAGTGYGNLQAFGSPVVNSGAEDKLVSVIGTQTATMDFPGAVAGAASVATLREAQPNKTITGIASITGINTLTM